MNACAAGSRQMRLAGRTPAPYQQPGPAAADLDAIRTVSYSRWDLDGPSRQVTLHGDSASLLCSTAVKLTVRPDACRQSLPVYAAKACLATKDVILLLWDYSTL